MILRLRCSSDCEMDPNYCRCEFVSSFGSHGYIDDADLTDDPMAAIDVDSPVIVSHLRHLGFEDISLTEHINNIFESGRAQPNFDDFVKYTQLYKGKNSLTSQIGGSTQTTIDDDNKAYREWLKKNSTRSYDNSYYDDIPFDDPYYFYDKQYANLNLNRDFLIENF